MPDTRKLLSILISGQPAVRGPAGRSYWASVFLLLIALALLLTTALAGADQDLVSSPLPAANEPPLTISAVGDPVPRIQCPAGYTARVYAEGLSSPDGLAFSPAGILYVAEETAGRVSRVEAYGSVTPVISGLANPEGIAFDSAGNLYVVEDVSGGRVVKMTTGGVTTTLATDLDAPEGVAWASDGTVYVTESNVQFTDNPLQYRTR
jgi:glucose/arabinose dehydrogenase